jgi:predicted MFS family arabinose efflux permease
MLMDFEDGTECDKLKNSIIGTINSIGVLLGNFLFHILSEKFGYKNLLFLFHIGHAIFLLISIFYSNYYYFQVINLFVMFFTKSLLNSSLVINNEIIDINYKALISSFVNLGLGIGGMFYVLMFYLVKDWKYVYIIGACLSVLSAVTIKIL